MVDIVGKCEFNLKRNQKEDFKKLYIWYFVEIRIKLWIFMRHCITILKRQILK